MKRKGIVVVLLMMLVLTGCASDSWIDQYAEPEGIVAMETQEDVKKAYQQLNREDAGQWKLREDKLEEMLKLLRKLEKLCVKYPDARWDLTEYETGDGMTKKEDALKKILRLKAERKEPYAGQINYYEISINAPNYEVLAKIWKELGEFGYERVKTTKPDDCYFMDKGYVFFVPDREEMDAKEMEYNVNIRIPAGTLYGPERYFDLVDFCGTNRLEVSQFVCRGGLVDSMYISLSHSGEIHLYIKDDNILELTMENYELSNFFHKEDEDSVIQLFARMCGNEGEAARLARQLENRKTLQGKSGKVGNRRWRIDTSGHGPVFYME